MHALPLVLALLSALVAKKAAAAERDEAWNLLLVDGEKAGYVHSVVEPTESGGHVTTIDSLFRIRRMGNDVKIHTTIVTTEGADGQVERIHQVADMAASETVQ